MCVWGPDFISRPLSASSSFQKPYESHPYDYLTLAFRAYQSEKGEERGKGKLQKIH